MEGAVTDALELADALDERADGHRSVATSEAYDAEITAHNAAVAAGLRVAAAEIREQLVDGEEEPIVDLASVTGEADG